MNNPDEADAIGLAERFATTPSWDDQCGTVYVKLGPVTIEQRELIIMALEAFAAEGDDYSDYERNKAKLAKLMHGIQELRRAFWTGIDADPKLINAAALKLLTTPLDDEDTMNFTQYRRKQIAELRPYIPGEHMQNISVSNEDKAAGSPRRGDMIARNPKNHNDQWLVAAKYFADNFEPL